MEPIVQLDPDRCILVLGPQIAAQCLATPSSPPPALSYNMLLEAGVQKMLDLENTLSTEEKIRKRALLVNAYELDPSFVGNVVVNSLKKHDNYNQWLSESFSTLSSLPAPHTTNQLVEKLQVLQRMGTLMIYTYYDMVLDRTLGTPPILMENEEDIHNWASRQTRGVLHVHGIHSKPESVCCDCVDYERIIGGSKGGRYLRGLCKTKTVIFAGFDGEFFDPFMPKFSSTFVDVQSSKEPPLLLSSMPKIPNTVSFLTLKIPQMASLEKVLAPSSRQVASREAIDSSRQPLSTTLLYADKKNCQDAAEHVKTISSINVHQLTMRHEQSHELELFLDREGLKALWKVLFSHGGQSSRLHVGLLGVTMGSNLTVWLKGPASLRLSEKSSAGHVTTPINHPPSLTTNVSVISSMYTPIASPSVSQPPTKHLTPSTRPTLPSPLITTTSRTLMGIGKAAQLLPPELRNRLPLINPHNHPRRVHSSQLRKARSAYYDRVTADPKTVALSPTKRNGQLVHRESAPEFVYTPEGVIAYQSNPRNPTSNTTPPKPNAATQPSPLLRDGSNIELKIEYIDQYLPSKPSKSNTSPQRSVNEEVASSSSSSRGKAAAPDFKNEKQQYIHDALCWSKEVGSRFTKRTGPPTSLPTAKLTSTSLSAHISPEEQEEMLQQHFEQIQKSSPLKHTSSANRLTVATTPIRSPGLPSPNRSPRFPKTSPKPGSLQFPSVSGSPLPSGINPFLLGQSTASTVFPFFGASPAIPGTSGYLPSPTTMSQLAAATSTVNPYHAMMHIFSQQGKKPVVVTDPSLIQGLQGSLPDTVPCFLPDGTVTLISTKVAMQGESEENEDTSKEERSPQNVRKDPKRGRTPEMERDVVKPKPKRRRSNSLPDIHHLGQGISEKPQEESIKEEQDEPEHKPTLNIHRGLRLFSDGLKPRELPPPNMIQIPQEVKMNINDPMLGFPTPQSSPPVGSFALSPFVVSAPYHHQPMTPITPNNESVNSEEMKEFVEASEAHTPPPPPPEGTSLPPFPQGRGPIQLWQFLLDLLTSPDKQHMIQWTGNGYEFRIILPEEIAKLWGARKNKPRMNYDKLSRGLRYYYSKGIMDKVPGKKLTFKYTCDVQQHIQKKSLQGNRYATTPLTPMSALPENTALTIGSNSDIRMQSVEGNSPHSKAAIQGSVFQMAISGKPSLFSSPMLSMSDSKVNLGASMISKSPSPEHSEGSMDRSPMGAGTFANKLTTAE